MSIYESQLQNQVRQEKQQFWEDVYRRAQELFKVQKNITLGVDEIAERRRSLLHFIRTGNRKSSPKEIRECYESLSKEERNIFKQYMQYERQVEIVLIIKKDNEHDSDLDSEPSSSKRKRRLPSNQFDASPKSTHSAVSRNHHHHHHHQALQMEEVEDHFIELSRDENNEGQIVSRQISVSALVKYLFEVVDSQRKELSLLKKQVEEQNRKLQVLLDSGVVRGNGGYGDDVAGQDRVDDFEFSGLLKSMH